MEFTESVRVPAFPIGLAKHAPLRLRPSRIEELFAALCQALQACAGMNLGFRGPRCISLVLGILALWLERFGSHLQTNTLDAALMQKRLLHSCSSTVRVAQLGLEGFV